MFKIIFFEQNFMLQSKTELSFISLAYNWGESLKYPLFLLLHLSIQFLWFDMLQK